jgi:hypothetical protein
MMANTKRYICVGGMPDAVVEYIKSKDMIKVNKIQKSILLDYRGDITKSQDIKTIEKVSLCFNSIPNQLERNNKRFNFSLITKTARIDRYEGALE